MTAHATTTGPYPDAGPMAEARALHRAMLAIDTHIDIPWPDRDDFRQDSPRRQVDLPKLARGAMGGACLVAYVAQGRTDAAGHAAAGTQALTMLDAIGRAARSGDNDPDRPTTMLCASAADIATARAKGAIAIIPAVENGYAMGEDLSLLARFRALGARYMTMTHNGHNALADSARPMPMLDETPERHGGLSALGREAVAEMNHLGILVDVSHTSRRTMLQCAETSRAPVFASHSCARALCDHPRNLDDTQLDALRACGGVAHVTAVDAFLRPRAVRDARAVTVTDFVDHIDYIAGRIGIAHVGISSDFDGGGGIEGWRNAAEAPAVTAEMLRRGYTATEIAAVWGGNFMRVLRAADSVATI